IRVTRHRKRRRSSGTKRPWYKSRRFRYHLEVFGKVLMVSIGVGVVLTLLWVIIVSVNQL
ncbi:hypothetical protein ACSTIN_23000, partial [Vibrio parahaemolyticus]